MMKKFNIAQALDLQKLDNGLDSFHSSFYNPDISYDPVILMSPETLARMPRLNECERFIGQSTRNNCTGMVGKYKGYKVFSDPTLDYGEIELR